MSKFVDPNKKTPFGDLQEVVCDTWPEPHLMAREGDVTAASIIAYAAKWKGHKDFPAAPWDPRRGEVNLRDLDTPQPPATDDPPRYRLKAYGFVNGALYEAGTEIRFDHWLNQRNLNLTANFEPLNETARLIHRYTTEFLHGRQMPGAPYTLGKLNLPNPALFDRPMPAAHERRYFS
jgi:hypothetical protein